jgi:tagatose 1,6-diphosphate aldolase
MQNVNEKINVLTDGEIELNLLLGLEKTKQFYYAIYDTSLLNKIGQCGIRLTDSVDQYLGNIEYEIFEPYQGNHYAYKASVLLSEVALLFGYKKVTITANPTNLASIKTIEKLGAKHLYVKDVPKSHRLYKKSPKVAIYEWNIEGKRK